MTGLCLFLELGAQVAALLARSATLPIALAIELVACHAAVFLIAGCDRAPIAKSLPNFQLQGRCLMRQSMTYTHLCAP